jgi:serine/threonine protein phosphatase PrpC
MRYVWATGTHQGRIRERNEDSVFPETSGAGEGPLLVGVADGMGGHVAGNIASTLALTIATEEPPDTDTTIVDRILAANQAIQDRVSDEPNLAGMGTTMTIGSFSDDGSATIGHVGDSRCYLMRDGELSRLTSDHTVVAELVALGHIKNEDVNTHPQRHLLTRSLGLGPVAVDTEEIDLQAGDRLLFCSDGLTSMLTDREITTILDSGSDLEATVWMLIEAANAAGGIDNITVAIVDAGP